MRLTYEDNKIEEWQTTPQELAEMYRVDPENRNNASCFRASRSDNFGRGTSSHHQKSWLGVTGTSQEVTDLFINGWKDGVKQLHEALNESPAIHIPPAMTIKRKRRRGIHGDNLDIHKVYAGQLDKSWEYRKREHSVSKSGRNITLMVNVGYHAGVNAEQGKWTGAAAVYLAEKLQASGRNVQIISSSTSEGGFVGTNKHYMIWYILKDYTQPMTLDMMASAIMLPAFFRMLIFRAWWDHKKDVHRSLGHPVKPIPMPKSVKADEVIHVADIFSKQAAQDFLNNTIKEIEK